VKGAYFVKHLEILSLTVAEQPQPRAPPGEYPTFIVSDLINGELV
jgi:hypothetical protein